MSQNSMPPTPNRASYRWRYLSHRWGWDRGHSLYKICSVSRGVRLILFIGMGVLFSECSRAVDDVQIKKVNQIYLDENGYPSATAGDFREKAVYQQDLERLNTYKTVRYLVHWGAPEEIRSSLTIQLEVRGYLPESGEETLHTVSKYFSKSVDEGEWVAMDIQEATLKRLGYLMAWKVSLLKGKEVMASRKSFTWDDAQASSGRPNQLKPSGSNPGL